MSLTRYDGIADSLKRVCDFQGTQPTATILWDRLSRNADVATELKVHHCSEDKAIEYPQAKVTRVSRHEVLENSCSLIRNFATWVDG